MTFVPQYATWRELELLVAYAGFSPLRPCTQSLPSTPPFSASMPRPVLWKSANPLICLC